MRQIDPLHRFLRADSGAVTVDWVVITAAITGLGIGVLMTVSNGIENSSNDITAQLESDEHIFRSHHFARSTGEEAAAVDLTHYGSNWADRRMNQLMNDLTDQQLRNQERAWRNRQADVNDPMHSRANDQMAMLSIAMEARGVSPHP
ncbi:Flp family type IVb pilin [Jannaschia pohangensis]|uniref:Flp pilus assembly protein, pilin Flp n=1 Tax=Jannaschia pohangensis TaxID=390807 RepID=A0A1I3S728_9RHOB|nr:hypothetical protein [Jannaschia pohangensis]SFJ53409.1 Flp pilus assembly protein, pilin Flp [Jannaschia pohangensis]